MRHRQILGQVWRAALAVAFAAAVAAAPAVAQNMQRRANGPMMYDTATETTLTGTVTAVGQMSGQRNMRGNMGGTHLTLKTDKETIEVRVGPSWYLQREKVHFAKGDKIEVTGSKVTYQGRASLIAREIKMGDRTITLRDAQGFPVWMHNRRGMGNGMMNGGMGNGRMMRQQQ